MTVPRQDIIGFDGTAAGHRGVGHTEAFAMIREKIRDSMAELPGRLRPRRAPMTPRGCRQIARERLRQALALCRRFSETMAMARPDGQDLAGQGPSAALRGR